MKFTESDNGLSRVIFLQSYRGYNAGEEAGFRKPQAEKLCGGKKPIAKPYGLVEKVKGAAKRKKPKAKPEPDKPGMFSRAAAALGGDDSK